MNVIIKKDCYLNNVTIENLDFGRPKANIKWKNGQISIDFSLIQVVLNPIKQSGFSLESWV
jgi:hypothetical protein